MADTRDRSRAEFRPVGPFVYGGTAGIALFLAQLAVVTGDAAAQRTALGAMRYAVDRASGTLVDGLYSGTPGVAWAAARVGGLLGVEGAGGSARELATPPNAARRAELVAGRAGTVIAQLGLGAELGELRFVDAAVEAGEALLSAATVRADQWSWPDPDRPNDRALCGLAHGASGIGWALLELFAVTGEDRWRAGASGAFAYERAHFDARSGTWPDLRRERSGPPGAMRGTWCYGEAGIGLSRIRATEVLGDDLECSDADIAIQVVRERSTEIARYAISDLSLCHGLAGMATALMASGEHDCALALAEVTLVRHDEYRDWPCDVPGRSPGLMRGTSGIGWWLLALADPKVALPLPLRIG